MLKLICILLISVTSSFINSDCISSDPTCNPLLANLLYTVNTDSESSSSPTPTSITLFVSTNYGGDLGIASNTRPKSDALCASIKTSNFASLTCTNVHVLLSFSAGDDVASFPSNYGMPTNLPVLGPTGIQIQTDWPTILASGTPTTSLTSTGVTSVADTYWTGSNAN